MSVSPGTCEQQSEVAAAPGIRNKCPGASASSAALGRAAHRGSAWLPPPWCRKPPAEGTSLPKRVSRKEKAILLPNYETKINVPVSTLFGTQKNQRFITLESNLISFIQNCMVVGYVKHHNSLD